MGWPTLPIREVVRPIDRRVRVDPVKSYRVLGMRSKIGGPFLRETRLGTEISASKLNRVKAGDFIYSRLFAWQGSFGVIPKQLDGAFVSGEFPIFEIDSERADPRFLVFWFGLPETQKTVEADCFGSTPGTRNRYKEEYFLNLSVPLPALDEQRRIVGRLSRVSGLAEGGRQLLGDLDREAMALMQSLHTHLSLDQKRPFGHFVELWEDKEVVRAELSYPQVGIKGFGGGLFAKSPVKGSETSYKRFNRLHEGLLVVSQPKGWEGAVAVCDHALSRWFVSPEYRTFRCREGEVLPQYLDQLICTPWFQMQLTQLTRGQGARRERLRPEMLLAMETRMPSVDAQVTAIRIAARYGSLRSARESAFSDLDALVPAMLRSAFAHD